MKDTYKQEQEANLNKVTLDVFIQYYNQHIPSSFPRATSKALAEFQETHLSLFDDSKLWVIDKHRKRLMDWLISYSVAI